MSTFSDKFDNHWKCIPYAMATLTSSDGFMILFHLLRRGYTDGDKTTCAISNKELADVMGTSISSVRRAIDTLKQLNLISCSQNKGALCTFYVNWSEIRAIHKVSSQISDKGWVYLRGLCLNSEVRPISAIPLTILNDVVRQYEHTSLNMNTPSLNMNTPSQIDEEKGEDIEKLSENIVKEQSNLVQYEQGSAQYERGCAQYEQGCVHIERGSAHIEQQNKIYIDNIENKENHNERSEFNKETDMKILEWFNSRDLSFPDLSSSDFETIINLPDFADNDFDMAIREVWGYLQYDEDSPGNYIPAEYFKDILYRAWNDLKTINPDFSLSEQDMKNIFGFDVEMQNGEPVCYVTPSKIKNINQSPSSSRKIKRKGVGDRTSRLIFLESIRQVAERDTNMLTDAEYAIWLMIEFVKERESNQQPRPSEVTKAVYEDLLKRFSNESKVPVEDLRTLWKELPQKNTVKLHPQQLSVDKIINYNVQVNQASDVEELYNKKMAEQP
ncbi:MAG: winged helix-turn-helix DNA binding protein [Bacteriophage sp.]|nr:MAG: winged helix-turn-helix DNA binding protein [Bacteriophage sp.]UWG72213.1 MAG: winged helix-turn-helix DNA binding protein [Bacteriophage sp.]